MRVRAFWDMLQGSPAHDRAMGLAAALCSFDVPGPDIAGFCRQTALEPWPSACIGVGLTLAKLARLSRWPFIAPLGLLALLRDDPATRPRGGIVTSSAFGCTAMARATLPRLAG